MQAAHERRMTIADVVIRLSICLPVTTLLQRMPALDGVNRVCMALLLLAAAFGCLRLRLAPMAWAVLLCTLALHAVALCMTQWPLYNANDVFYFAAWVVYMLYFAANLDGLLTALRKNARFLHCALLAWHAVILVSALFPSSYLHVDGGVYFVSFTGTGFRLGPSALLAMALALVRLRLTGRRRDFCYTLLPLLCAYVGGSRTYVGVCVLLFVCGVYIATQRKALFYAMLLPLCAALALLVLVMPSMDKILATTYSPAAALDFWGAVTNGRTIFWRAELSAYFALPPLQLLAGSGFHYVYEVNLQAVGNAIWAHNDFLNLLLTFGVLGVFCYLYCLRALYRAVTARLGRLAWPLALGFVGIWLVNAFFNMVYTYTCAMLSLPFMLVAFCGMDAGKEGDP